MSPEAAAREKIDAFLVKAGWVAQYYKAFSLSAARGIRLGEIPLAYDRCDFLLLVDRIPLGAIEAKHHAFQRCEQSAHYGENLVDEFRTSRGFGLPSWST